MINLSNSNSFYGEFKDPRSAHPDRGSVPAGVYGRTPACEPARGAGNHAKTPTRGTNTRLADDRLGVTRSDGKMVSGGGADVPELVTDLPARTSDADHQLRPPTLDARLGSSGNCTKFYSCIFLKNSLRKFV